MENVEIQWDHNNSKHSPFAQKHNFSSDLNENPKQGLQSGTKSSQVTEELLDSIYGDLRQSAYDAL